MPLSRYWFLLAVLLFAAACRQTGNSTTPPETATVSREAANVQSADDVEEAGRAPKATADARTPTSATAVSSFATTPDPTLPAWTVLVYINGDNLREPSALQAFEALTALETSENVNILVQVDRDGQQDADEALDGARRYAIGMEDGGGAKMVSIGEVNMGEAATLADFLSWGISSYPANRLALVFWDHAGGAGSATYDATSDDQLLMEELAEAIASGLAATGVPRLDIIALGAAEATDLALLNAIEPYTLTALPMGRAEDMTAAFLGALLAAPDAATWTVLAEYLSGIVSESAVANGGHEKAAPVDLLRLETVNGALSELVTALQAVEPGSVVGPIAASRYEALRGPLSFQPGDLAAGFIDVELFAAGILRRAPNFEIRRSAERLVQAVAETAAATTSDMPGVRPAIRLYLPDGSSALPAAYLAFAPAGWAEFLAAYQNEAQDGTADATVDLIFRDPEVASVQQLLYTEYELAGWGIGDFYFRAVEVGEDGRSRLLALEPIMPAIGDSGAPEAIGSRDDLGEGVHEGFHVWDALAIQIGDVETGGPVLSWPAAPGRDLVAIEGNYWRAGTESPLAATLLLERQTADLHSAWIYLPGALRSEPRRLLPQAGDRFQADDVYLGDEGSLNNAAGAVAVFDEEVSLPAVTRPVPGGNYGVGFVAELASAVRVQATETISVTTEQLLPGFRAYLDPTYGFQFLFPATWRTPTYEGGQLVGGPADDDLRLTVTPYEAEARDTASSLKARALQQFGAVSVLYEEPVVVVGQQGLMTAYGYEAEGVERTGIFVSFVYPDRQVGVVIDLDGPATAEPEMLELMRVIFDSWQFRALSFGEQKGKWRIASPAEAAVPVPASYSAETLDNGWDLFRSEDGFIALRDEAASSRTREAITRRWLEVAGGDVTAFEAGEPSAYTLGGHSWIRNDFRYEDSGDMIRGFVMTTVFDSREVVAWAEARADVFDDVERTVFAPLVAATTTHVEGGELLLYGTEFDDAENWGAGSIDGASGSVVDGAYQMSATADAGFFWTTAGQTLADGVYTVVATQEAGTLNSSYGMLVRAGEGDSFYVFAVSGDGFVWVGRCTVGCAEAVSLEGNGWVPNDAVNVGHGASNLLRVDAEGAQLDFYVNDQLVSQIEDSALARGDIGLFVETLGEGGVEVSFDDFRVFAK